MEDSWMALDRKNNTFHKIHQAHETKHTVAQFSNRLAQLNVYRNAILQIDGLSLLENQEGAGTAVYVG